MERLECNVCYLRYNEADRRPRVLPCGHSFCTPCLTATIQKGSRTCPGCREPINTMSATRLPINFELESLLNLLTEAENSGSVGQDPGMRLSVAPTVGAMSCPEHNLEVAFRCTTHKAWICRRCTVIDHPSGTCKVVSVKEEIKIRKQEQDKTIHAELKNYKEAIVNVETYAKQLEVEEKKHEDIIKKLEAIIKRHREAKDRLVEKRESLKGAYFGPAIVGCS
ncbi:unnamed protein product [Meganyctiphanes norvegica]|uniref:RING-type domain-containing protein n=1 Tax=Meganyctiphanes norvegica TaxID=48144 RepID=A0AAV2RS54_MEGNR